MKEISGLRRKIAVVRVKIEERTGPLERILKMYWERPGRSKGKYHKRVDRSENLIG
jgi:hypothetical protein